MRQSDIDAPGDKPLVRALLALDAALEASSVNADDAVAVEALVREADDANADLRYFSDADIYYDALFDTLYRDNSDFSRGERLPLAARAVFALTRARGASLCTATSVLMQYIREPHVTVANIAWLVERGANIRADHDFAVQHAAANGHLAIVQWLVEHGANIHADLNFSVRHAAKNGHLAMVQWLVERGADIRSNNDYAVRWAAEHGQLVVVQWLVEHGADVDAISNAPINVQQWLDERSSTKR